MRYVFLLYGPEGGMDDMSPDERDAELARWFTYDGEMRAAGIVQGGEALHPTSTATSVRMEGGKVLMTDGPFAETKEAIGGFYLLDVPSLDVALEWAAKCPALPGGTVEVRPVMEFDMPGDAG